MIRVFLLILVSQVFADSRLSQGHIKYSDGSGTNVDWKLYAPYSQLKSQSQNYERKDNAKTLPVQPRVIQPVQSPVGVAAKSLEPRYKPFSQVPHHLKKLLMQSYEPQIPYVNPEAFVHQVPQYSFGKVSPHEPQPLEYQSQAQSSITRPQNQQDQQQKQNFGDKELEGIQEGRNHAQVPAISHQPSIIFDKSVPLEIQQLLQYQAQIPYNVIANNIIYKPETPFVPEPLPEDEAGTYKYRSRVYYPIQSDVETKKVQEHPVKEDNEDKEN